MNERYTTVAIPGILILLAVLLVIIRTNSWLDGLPTGVFVTAMFIGYLLPEYQIFDVFARRQQHKWERIGALIEAEHQDGDVILYATGFVELDAVVHGEASAATQSFAEFPAIAHLDRARRLPRHALPYGRSQDSPEVMGQTLMNAARAKRAWVVGTGSALEYFAKEFAPRPQIRVLFDRTDGTLMIFLVEFR